MQLTLHSNVFVGVELFNIACRLTVRTDKLPVNFNDVAVTGRNDHFPISCRPKRFGNAFWFGRVELFYGIRPDFVMRAVVGLRAVNKGVNCFCPHVRIGKKEHGRFRCIAPHKVGP